METPLVQKWTGTAAVGPGETAPRQWSVPCEHPCSQTIHAGSLETPARGGRGRERGRERGGRGRGGGRGGGGGGGRGRGRGRGRGATPAWLAFSKLEAVNVHREEDWNCHGNSTLFTDRKG